MFEQLKEYIDPNCENLGLESKRVFHGRGHCYEGLEFINIDWFSPVLWVVVYRELTPDEFNELSEILNLCIEGKDAIQCVMVQQRYKGKSQQHCIKGDLPEELQAHEKGINIALNLSANQNTGYFPDALPAREWLQEVCEGKRVLNLFAYTCAFSLAALKGGASHVVNIDMAKSALATGQRNHAINDLDVSKASFLPHDIFRSTRRLENLGPYDVVIVDPPSRQKGSFEADKDYVRLLKKLEPMFADNCQVLACLNAPYLPDTFLLDAFDESLPEYKLEKRLPQREDFPEKDLARCLKMMVFKQ
jgi:23S rRNA (cytosine1962-C5)-methyltransferase